MKSSLSLVREANDLLDSVAEEMKIREANILRLEAFREEMVESGFNAPFSALLKITREELEEMEESDVEDLKKQMRNIKYIANLKKFTLKRVRVALASHKIGKSAIERGQGELLEFLPLDGNHIRVLAKLGEAGLNAYGELMKLVGNSGRGYRAVVEVEIEQEGKKIVKQIKLGEGERADERVRREFGEGAKLKSMRIVKAYAPMIKSKSSRVAMICAEVGSAHAKARRRLGEEEKKNEKVHEYNSLLAAEKLERDVRIDLASGFEELKERMIEKGLAKRDEKSSELVLDEGLEAEIRRRRALLGQMVWELAAKNMLSDMLRFYILNGKAEREAGTICPSLAAEPEGEQLDVFEPLSGMIGVKKVGAVVAKKFEREKLGLGMRSAPFGAAVFSLESGKGAKWCAEFFKVKEEEILEAIEKVKAAGAGAGEGEGRGTEFLKKMKKGS